MGSESPINSVFNYLCISLTFPQKSEGGAACFSDLKVGVYKEIVPMGVDPAIISYRLAGKRNTLQLA